MIIFLILLICLIFSCRYDALTGVPSAQKSVAFEKGSVLFNMASIYTQVGAKQVIMHGNNRKVLLKTKSDLYSTYVMQHIKREGLAEATCISCVNHILLFIFWLCTIRLMPPFYKQNPSLLEDLFQETINKTIKNMANIVYYHGDKRLGHM